MAVLVLIKRRHVAQVSFIFLFLIRKIAAGIYRDCWDDGAGPHQAEAHRSGIIHLLCCLEKSCTDPSNVGLRREFWDDDARARQAEARRSGSLLHL